MTLLAAMSQPCLWVDWTGTAGQSLFCTTAVGASMKVPAGEYFMRRLYLSGIAEHAVDNEMGDVNVLGREFACHGLGKSTKGKLTHREGCRLSVALDARGCAREQDRAGSLSEHASHGLLSDQESSEGAHAESACDLRGVEFDQRAAQPSTRVIDNDVGRDDAAFHFLEEARHLIGVDDIAGESLRPGLRRQGREFPGIASCGGDAHAFAGKESCETGAESRAGACDQRDLISQCCHWMPPYAFGAVGSWRRAQSMPPLPR